ncbi:TRAP transporter small permease [Salipaludibacillus sp. CF4.18]|uniref:TRAP transporter small permease n=1 Tax=Salipaludibacillus sp. CF4.18 TaxID=3373081 RepID=UPI003EE68612
MWERVVKKTNRIVENLTCTLFVVMVLLVFLQIVSRVLFSSSFAWTEELARYLMIWITFLGASVGFQYSSHISVEYFINKFKPRYAKWMQVTASTACLIFLSVLLIKGIDIIDRSMIQKSASLRIPIGFIYYIMPISAILMAINIIDITLKTIRVNPTGVEN